MKLWIFLTPVIIITILCILYRYHISHIIRKISNSSNFFLKDELKFTSVKERKIYGLESIVNDLYKKFKMYSKICGNITLSELDFLKKSYFVLYYNNLPRCLPSFGFLQKNDDIPDFHCHLKFNKKLRSLYAHYLLTHRPRNINEPFFKIENLAVTADVFIDNSILNELGLDYDGDRVTYIMIPLETILTTRKGEMK